MEELGLPLNINLQKYKYKYAALYHSLKDIIIDGQLGYGYKLPASRELSAKYSLSRGIVNQVYEMLAADGYIETIVGSGSYVSYLPPENSNSTKKQTNKYTISDWGKRLATPKPLASSPKEQPVKIDVNFALQHISLSDFPVEEWKKAVKQGMREMDFLLTDLDPDPRGLPALREAIANHLNIVRGMKVRSEEIVIVNGSVHAMAILGQLLVNEGDNVMVEDPCYMRLQNIIKTAGGTPVPFQTNDKGEIIIENLNSNLVFVTPTHKYPTGRVMTFEERTNLLKWANENDALIIEDDIDSIFKRTGQPIEPLKVIDSEERVFYLGTFAYTILPTMRIGYAVVPDYIRGDFLRAKYLFEPFSTSVVEQASIAAFMKNGSYAKHIRKMQRLYLKRYKKLMELFSIHLPTCFTWTDSGTGMYVFGWWNESKERYEEFKDKCRLKGVAWDDPSGYFMKPTRPSGMFYFSNVSEDDMELALRRMGEVYQGLERD